ncbi:hypothetical protein ACHQM5_028134 [Ranunculus cassubicifolius]
MGKSKAQAAQTQGFTKKQKISEPEPKVASEVGLPCRYEISVRGLDSFGTAVEMYESLNQHFKSCGEIWRFSVPEDKRTKERSFAVIEFKDEDSVSNALRLNGYELDGHKLKVTKVDH